MKQNKQAYRRLNRLLIKCSLVAMLAMPAVESISQNVLKTAITIDESKLSLDKILQQIAARTNVKLAYDVKQVKQYTITLRDKKTITLEELFQKILQQTDLTFQNQSNTIVIYPKNEPSAAVMQNNATFAGYASYIPPKETITGTVSDENGPLQSASVYIKGTSNGTLTDADGKFSLTTDADGKELTFVVSLVGYQTKELTVSSSQTTLSVRLTRAITQLEDVVVVGYGTQQRSKVTGAVAKVQLDKATSRSINNIADLLQGKAPGVVVGNEGGDPTVSPHINIRGLGGINGESVLYVVDGAVITGSPVLNPNEIESIDVLKDASAAIYGARASGGVILITTKKGKNGAASITLDAKYGVQSAWRKLQALDAKEFADVMNLAADNAGKPRQEAFDASVYPDGQVTKTNWVDDVFRTGKTNEYSVSINGGTDKSKYFMGFSYRNMEGILLNTYARRYSFRINMENQLKPWLKIGENMSYFYLNGNGANTTSGYTGAIISAIFYPPSVAPYNADGTFAGLPAKYAGAYGDVINPVAYLMRLDYKNPTGNLFVNPYAEIKLLPELTFRSNFAYTKQEINEKYFTPRVLEIGKIFDYNQLNQNTFNFTDILAEQTLTFNKKFGEHNLNAVAGYSYQQREWDKLQVYVQDFNDERSEYRYLQNGNSIYKPYSEKTKDALVSYFARINYDYKGKYLLSLINRYDGSSLVAKQNRFENYPSISAGWVVGKEGFLENVNWLSNLKLRASYGLIGNLGSVPNTAVSPPLSQTAAYLGQDPTQVFGYAATALPNKDLKWARSRQLNFGIDAGILKNKVTLIADYFIKKSERMLMAIQPPSTTGVGTQWVNGGDAKDKGIELGLGYNSDPRKAFTYGMNATLTKITNKLVSLPNNQTNISTSGINVRGALAPVLIQVGSPLYSYYVIKTAGLFQSQSEIDSYKNKDGNLIQPNAKPGDIKFVDANNDGRISNDDRVVVGNPYPDFTYSFSFNASYKGFDINIFAQGVQNNKIFNALKYTGLNASSGQNYNMLKDVLNAWSPTHTNTSIPRVSASDANGNFGNTSDFYIEKGSYLRIKNVTLGYTLPAALTSRYKVNSVRAYITANNLLTFTGYSGFDPEVGMDQYGIDLARYPQARSFIFGLSVNF